MICPKCHAQIPAADVDLGTLVAKCQRCDEVFSFADQVGARHPAAAPPREELAPKPTYIRVEDDERRRLWWRWLGPEVFFLLFFCIAWDSFLVFWYSMAFNGNAPWLMIVFPIAHVAVGIGLTYFVVALFFNSTEVAVEDDRLAVRHGPVPWPGNRLLPAGLIERLFCQEQVNRGRNSTSVSYGVHAVVEGNNVRLVSGMKDKLAARFVQQQLEDWLGLAKRKPGLGSR